MDVHDKLAQLRKALRDTQGLAVAFSGGLDSTFLAAVAHEELGDRSIAVTALSPTYPAHEQTEAGEVASSLGIRHITVESNELDIPGFADNPPDRCYHCKSELFTVVRDIAAKHDIANIADGTNADDLDDFRPGRRAACELQVLSPLLDAGMTKADIRELSREMSLPTADKPAFACLASRFPYGSEITQEKLASVDAIEECVRALGINQVRVRHHGDIARVEVEPSDIARITEDDNRQKVVAAARSAGFNYVAVDLQGYRTGSMNEVLPEEQKKQ